MAGDVGDVFGGFQAAFNFETDDTGFDQIVRQGIGCQILRAEQVFHVTECNVFAVADDFVGQAAGLGTLAAVGASPAQGFAGQTLPGIGDAEGPVDKGLEFDVGFFSNGRKLADGQLAGQYDALDAESVQLGDAFGAGHRHLGRRMNRKVRANSANDPGEADVLDEDGIDSCGGDLPNQRLDAQKLVGEDKRVQRDVALHTTLMKRCHNLRQVIGAHVFGPSAGVEADVEAEVHGVGAIFDGRPDAFAVAGGGEKLRTAADGRLRSGRYRIHEGKLKKRRVVDSDLSRRLEAGSMRGPGMLVVGGK
jgi:hypothetical protein